MLHLQSTQMRSWATLKTKLFPLNKPQLTILMTVVSFGIAEYTAIQWHGLSVHYIILLASTWRHIFLKNKYSLKKLENNSRVLFSAPISCSW
jgi:hypothetical protein